MVAEQQLPTSYATDDGCGIVFRGTEVHEVIADTEGAQAYRVELVDGTVVESPLAARLLGAG
jgi:hypothetical protein